MKRTLIVIDMQNDFVTGPLGTEEPSETPAISFVPYPVTAYYSRNSPCRKFDPDSTEVNSDD